MDYLLWLYVALEALLEVQWYFKNVVGNLGKRVSVLHMSCFLSTVNLMDVLILDLRSI